MKKLWNKNRVIFFLVIILIVCFIAIVCVALSFFYSKDVSIYGSRLDDIKKYPVDDNLENKYEDYLLKNEFVSSVKINLSGRVLYVNVNFKKGISLEDAKALVTNSLEVFSEKMLSYYDIEFVLSGDDFSTIGAKNSIIDHISWNNNRIVKEEEETDEN